MDIRVVCRRPTVACAKATVGFLFLVLLGAPAAQAQDIPAPSLEGVDRLLGGVVVLAPDYEGSDDYEVAIGPLANFKFAGDRSVRVLGNRAFLNVLNSKTWEVGPKAVFRGPVRRTCTEGERFCNQEIGRSNRHHGTAAVPPKLVSNCS